MPRGVVLVHRFASLIALEQGCTVRRNNRVVWKLSIPVVAIVTLAIAAAGIANNVISNRYTLESAREVLRLNTESIVAGANKLMMSGNNDAVLEWVHNMSEGHSVYQDIRIVSHYSGEVVSHADATDAPQRKEDRSCAVCHDHPEPTFVPGQSLDEIITAADGTRTLYVITPVANKHGCRTASCHAHADAGTVIGFVQAEYSLGELDAQISGLNKSFAAAALAAILLGTAALWVTFRRTLTRPIRELLAGIRALAGNNLTFRFRGDRDDEFGLVGESFNNMAERIQAHQSELRETSEYLEGIVENSADIIITVNPQGKIQTVNRGAEMALDYTREELVGQPIEVLFANPAERDVAIARLRDQDNVSNFETSFLTKNKETRNVLLTLSRLRDRDGNPVGTFGISKDVTREKNLQARLFQYEKEAAIGQAVTAIQHAIKNMLNTLTGGSYVARHGLRKNKEASIVDGLNMVDEGIAKIREMTSTMLSYARDWKLRLENIDLTETVRGVLSAIKQEAADKNIALEVDIADDLPLVSCDAQLINMTIMDIAKNALDACWAREYRDGEQARVTFRVYQHRDEYRIEIADNGEGMTEETKKKLFTPFFSTKEQWGTGVGLASSHRIVSLHGGEITVQSEPDRGATFTITLPLWNTGANQGA